MNMMAPALTLISLLTLVYGCETSAEGRDASTIVPSGADDDRVAELSDDRPINELPMYGGLHDPQVEPNESKSEALSRLGWKYLYSGDESTAIKRFNQAWMFNRKNPEAFWGFGIIMGRRASQGETEKRLKDSIKYLQMASDLAPENGRILGDIAFSHTILGSYYKSEQKKDKAAEAQFAKAGKLFADAFRADPKYPPIVANWSVFYFYTGDYQKAKSKADEAIKMGYKFSPDYINDFTVIP
jgi:tetratricopeptide (TPR) repeat protein